MGIYLNPGKNAFEMAVDSKIYVDKTSMISFLNTVINTNQRYLSVSRPRRFGKTITADMICAYYDRDSDSRELFSGLKISDISDTDNHSWDEYLGSFDVIRVVMTDFIKKDIEVDASLKKMQNLILRDIFREYDDVDYYDKEDLIQSLSDLYASKKHRFVIVIDEWDAVFRIRKDDRKGQQLYLDFLRDWLKDKEYVSLAYITGILPIKKYGEHSALNMFNEYSMASPLQLAEYTGFTEAEVRALCDQYGRDYEQLKKWYNGYMALGAIPAGGGHESDESFSLYSPLSVVNAVTTGRIMNYWNKTETYEALAEYIKMDFDGLKDTVALLMEGGRKKIDLNKYQNDMTTFSGQDDILALLVHLGYLGYDEKEGEVFIPNEEIRDEFVTSTSAKDWEETFSAFALSQKLLKATWEKDSDTVAAILEEAHDRVSNMNYNSEAALSYAVQYAYYSAQKYYSIFPEPDTGKGYADILYIPSPRYPDKPAMLVELKYNDGAVSALEQIKRQKYPERLKHYKGNVLLVGINYDASLTSRDKNYKKHSCIITEG